MNDATIFFIPELGQERIGVVTVRQEELDPDESSLWRTKVGIVVEPPDPGLVELFARVAKQQKPE